MKEEMNNLVIETRQLRVDGSVRLTKESKMRGAERMQLNSRIKTLETTATEAMRVVAETCHQNTDILSAKSQSESKSQEGLRAQINREISEKTKLVCEISGLRESLKGVEGDLALFRVQNRTLDDKLRSLDALHVEKSVRVAELEQGVEEIEKKRALIAEELEETVRMLELEMNKSNSLERKCDGLSAELSEEKSKTVKLVSENDVCRQVIQELKEQLKNLNELKIENEAVKKEKEMSKLALKTVKTDYYEPLVSKVERAEALSAAIEAQTLLAMEEVATELTQTQDHLAGITVELETLRKEHASLDLEFNSLMAKLSTSKQDFYDLETLLVETQDKLSKSHKELEVFHANRIIASSEAPPSTPPSTPTLSSISPGTPSELTWSPKTSETEMKEALGSAKSMEEMQSMIKRAVGLSQELHAATAKSEKTRKGAARPRLQ